MQSNTMSGKLQNFYFFLLLSFWWMRIEGMIAKENTFFCCKYKILHVKCHKNGNKTNIWFNIRVFVIILFDGHRIFMIMPMKFQWKIYKFFVYFIQTKNISSNSNWFLNMNARIEWSTNAFSFGKCHFGCCCFRCYKWHKRFVISKESHIK